MICKNAINFSLFFSSSGSFVFDYHYSIPLLDALRNAWLTHIVEHKTKQGHDVWSWALTTGDKYLAELFSIDPLPALNFFRLCLASNVLGYSYIKKLFNRGELLLGYHSFFQAKAFFMFFGSCHKKIKDRNLEGKKEFSKKKTSSLAKVEQVPL